MSFKILKLQKEDQKAVNRILRQFWADTCVVIQGKMIEPIRLSGFKAVFENDIVGMLHYQIRDQHCEIITLASLKENIGIGNALIHAVKIEAKQQGCRTLQVITTNDNLRALRFYQKRGFHLVSLFPDQLDISRSIKPTIPDIGLDGIPLRDEILLEKVIE